MPYIDAKVRPFVEPHSIDPACEPGALAYQITFLVRDYLRGQSKRSYAHYAEVIGVLETTKLEIVRRLVNLYENEKVKAHGDVFQAGEDF